VENRGKSRLKEAGAGRRRRAKKEIQAQGTEKKKQLDAAHCRRRGKKIIAPVAGRFCANSNARHRQAPQRHGHGPKPATGQLPRVRQCAVLPHILQELRTETNEESISAARELRPHPVHAGTHSCGESFPPISANASSAASTNFLMPSPARQPPVQKASLADASRPEAQARCRRVVARNIDGGSRRAIPAPRRLRR